MPKELTAAVPLDDELPLETADDAAGAADAGAAGGDDAPGGDGASPEGAQPAVADPEVDPEALAALVAEDEAAAKRGIPPERFNEVNERAKRAEAEAAELRQALLNMSAREKPAAAPAPEPPKPRDFEAEFEALQKRYDDGDLDEAQMRREERKLIREEAEANALKKLAPLATDLQAERERIAMERLQAELNAESQKAFAKYPFLDHTAAGHNPEAIAAVLKERDELINTGVAPAKALRLAVAAVAPGYAEATPAPAGQTPDQIAAARRAKAREAAATADAAQPPPVGGLGNGARTTGAQRLTASVKDHDKWEKTPEDQRDKAFVA